MDPASPGDVGLVATLSAAGVVLVWSVVGAIRRRLKSGKRVLPRVRVKTYFSISTPDSEPPTKLDDRDVEIIDSRREPGPTSFHVEHVDELDGLDERETNRPPRGERERRRRAQGEEDDPRPGRRGDGRHGRR